ncbi:helix-turn-helix transcriptional regulator [Pseudonocardia xishanensis]|uniref:Helix-turn-helix transcriptional regulator n=1 Tax=Pseudonocardia xishanensis TaxID=630995 RepID=A0ABP8RZ35_9PSEU
MLAGMLAAAGAGSPGVAVVSGEAGVGKTRLVSELAVLAARTGALVLSGAAVDVGESPPLLPLTLAVRALDAGGLAVLEPWRAELAGLGVLPGPGAAASHPLDLAGRVLVGAAADRVVLWIVEDVQWADRATRDLLTYLTATMGSARLLVVVTHREGGGAPGLDALGLGGLRRHPRVHDLRLTPLDRAAVAQLVSAAALPAEIAAPEELVWRRSQGNPFIVEETLRALRDRDPRAVTGGLEELVLGRVRALSPDARTVVRALSVAEGAVSHDLTALVTALPAERLLAALREVVEEGSVVLAAPGPEGGAGGYRLRHGLAVDVVADDLLPAERRDLHRRFATALTALVGTAADSPAVAGLLAHHWDRAGDGERALAAAAEAAEAAEQVRGYADAYRHWRRASELVEPGGAGVALPSHAVAPRIEAPVAAVAPRRVSVVGRAETLVRAAEAAHLAGEHEAAITTLRERLTLAADRTLLARLGDYLVAAGRGVEAEEVFREVLGAGADTDAHALAGHAEALQLAGRLAEAQAEARRALAAARASGELGEQARVLLTLGYSLAYLEDTAAGAEALAEGLRVAEASGSAAALGRAYHGRAELLSGPLGAVSDGIDLALAGAARLTELGHGRTHGVRLLALAANGQFRCGRWDEAVEVIDRAFTARPSGSEALDIRLSRGRMRVGRGDLVGAAEDLDVVEMLAHDTTGGRYKVPLLTLRAGLEMFLGRPERGIAHTLAGLDLTNGHDDVWLDAALVWHGLRAHAECVRLDRPPPAPEVAARLRRHLAALPGRADRAAPAVAGSVRMFAQMSEAEASRADGVSDPAQWGDVAREWERRDQPYNVAYGLLRRAEALLAERTRNRAAAEDLQRAFELLRGLGARPLLDEVRDLARRARVTLPDDAPPRSAVAVPAARGDRLATLTPREREVLTEIAAGLTNREIAQRLFISEKTVGIHITHLFAKLGVRSRVQAGAVYLHAHGVTP